MPHDRPSVGRVQACDSAVVGYVHAPATHFGVVTVRYWVPVVSQVLANPPHAPQLP